MDPRAHTPTQDRESHSLYGFDMTEYLRGDAHAGQPACDVALHAVTHGGIYPLGQARLALGAYERAALDVLQRHRELRIDGDTPADVAGGTTLALYVNSLGRLHIRPASEPKVAYEERDSWVDLGTVTVGDDVLAEIDTALAAWRAIERRSFAEVRAAMDRAQAEGNLSRILEEVIDHVEHVESVCFYVGDRFFALIDRFTNLIDSKTGKGHLPRLRELPYAEWSEEDVLIVAALNALFLSGRSVRFEEFNGALLTAQDVVGRLNQLAASYTDAGCEVAVPLDLDLFERAQKIREQTLCAIGKPWLRYRWIYGLNFQKTERILHSAVSTEAHDQWYREFGDDFRQFVSPHGEFAPPEYVAMALLANAAIARDVAGVPCEAGSAAVTSWIEYLIEKTVASAVLATGSDYGMSSSLRDIGQLVTYDEPTLIDTVHALTPASFFTAYVSHKTIARYGDAESKMIASSVQKRMQFNRWHFIPGNFERPLIRSSRHWYYPPLVPDISSHSDMHRAAHNRARVKYSIRVPGPDMSRPPLNIAGQRYRGFYDVRIVRAEGDEYSTEDMLRVRRRTLWLEALYTALVNYLMTPDAKRLVVKGFEAGTYLDLAGDVLPNAADTLRAAATEGAL
ncbi:hypothetical protein [Burkholderia stagnalis]|uniref:hypothetical protein n=1 Tax=Burkholderia stagnalis TaxID=1503054 RepID=UPI0007568AC4|nr:hypothetical protein [Burkholderia stagnalis]KVC59164.1 hypothetical protein WS59_21955 [Burkholderia stagnalis]KVN22012.1 hypothetical protein WT10_11800 [Burkholderia stagnalis]KWI65493.1 hypothetical protein WT75_29120 [Burkholderia stagnalis]KWK63186.1 hypothetical protein WT82_03210 [Burkholderia stagnalis]KWN25087.1 hypothetical protein WT84_07050 [Burkholderia stagnalis]